MIFFNSQYFGKYLALKDCEKDKYEKDGDGNLLTWDDRNVPFERMELNGNPWPTTTAFSR